MVRKAKRFKVTSKKPNGAMRVQRSVDLIVEAWDLYAYYTRAYPLDDVEIEDRQEDTGASSR